MIVRDRSRASAAAPTTLPTAQPLKAFVLLEDRLRFHVGDVHHALVEDFPNLDWSGAAAIPDLAFDTSGVAAVPIACGKGVGPGVVFGGGPPSLDWDGVMRRNRIAAEGEFAERLVTSLSHLEITVGTSTNEVGQRLSAARTITAIASVFATLPIATGVLLTWCDRLMPPAALARAAQAVRDGEAPLMDWVKPVAFRDPDLPDHISAVTLGLAAFLGVEVEARQTPEAAPEAIATVLRAARAILDQGKLPADGATMDDLGLADMPHRIRLLRGGGHGNETDRLLLLHPESPFRDRKVLGKVAAKRPEHSDTERSTRHGLLARGLSAWRRGAPDGAQPQS